MLTAQRVRTELRNLPTVEYPDEVIERLKAESAVARSQYAMGEIKPMSASEIAAMWGMSVNG